MPTANLTGGSPATTSYSNDTATHYFSWVTIPYGRTMSNGSRNIYIEKINLYIAGRSGTTSCRAWFAGYQRGSSTNFSAQSTPSLKSLTVGYQATAGNTNSYGFYSSAATNFRRGSSAGSTENGKSGYVWSSALSGTFEYAEAPPAPSFIEVTNITQTSMKVRFSSNGDGGSSITGWRLQYSTSSSFPSNARWTVSSSGTTTLTGLTPGTKYYLRCAGKNIVTDNEGTYGPWSTVWNRTTLANDPPSVPRSPSVVPDGVSGALFSWLAPSSEGSAAITNYKVEYSTDPAFGASFGGVQGTSLSMTTGDLAEGIWYFRVAARNSSTATYSGWSSVVSIDIGSTVPIRNGYISSFDGVDFVSKPVKVFLSGTWVQKKVKVLKNSTWIELP